MIKSLAIHLHKYGLSKSQIDIILQVYTGRSTEQIAKDRHTTVSSVKSLLWSSYKKIFVTDKYELMLFCNYFLFPQYRTLFYNPGSVLSLIEDEPPSWETKETTEFKKSELYTGFILPKGRD